MRRWAVASFILVAAWIAPWIKKNYGEDQYAQKYSQNEPSAVSDDDRIADYNYWLTVLTAVLASASVFQFFFLIRNDKTARRAADAARDAGKAAIESNKINRDAMIADQRPWVSVIVDIAGPLTWNVQGANFVFNFTVENTGRTPALNTFVRLMIYPDLSDEIARQKEFSTLVREKSPARGITLFPNKPSVYKLGGSIYAAQLEELTRSFSEAYNAEIEDIAVQPLLIGFVTYYSAFDGVQHQTGFIRYILRSGPTDGLIRRSVGDLGQDRLRLMMPPMSDGVTD